MPTAGEMHQHFRDGAPWIDPQKTVDTIKVGDQSRPVTTVAVGWMSTIYDLRRAVELGCSEHWGMRNCADYVRNTWPGLTVHYLDLYHRPWTMF